MILSLLLFQTPEYPIIDKYGFPIFIAMAGLFFAWRVWLYGTKKIDEKDAEIKDSRARRIEFDDRLITTQNNILHSIDTGHEIAREIKDAVVRHK